MRIDDVGGYLIVIYCILHGLFHHVRYAYLWLHLSNAKIIHLMNRQSEKVQKGGIEGGEGRGGRGEGYLDTLFHQLLNTPVHGEGGRGTQSSSPFTRYKGTCTSAAIGGGC